MVGALKLCFVRENYVPCAKWFYGLTEGWEVFKNLPNSEYGLAATRGDPTSAHAFLARRCSC